MIKMTLLDAGELVFIVSLGLVLIGELLSFLFSGKQDKREASKEIIEGAK